MEDDQQRIDHIAIRNAKGMEAVISLTRDPTMQEIHNLCISDPMLLETAMFLSTAFLGEGKYQALNFVVEKMNSMREVYTSPPARLNEGVIRSMCYDLMRATIVRIRWDGLSDVFVCIDPDRRANILCPFEKTTTIQDLVQYAIDAAQNLGEEVSDYVAQALIIHTEFIRAFNIPSDNASETVEKSIDDGCME